MSDIIKWTRTQQLVDRMAQKYNRTPSDKCLLLDISSSMDEYGKIDKLRDLADDFKGVRRFVFSDRTRELRPTEMVPCTEGGTGMHSAFEYVKKAGIRHCVIITDGMPDLEDEALKAAIGLRVDIYYVGPEPAPDFLRKLAEGSGGKYGTASLDDLKELGTSIKGLIGSGSGAIQL